jgi:hypothetical protein
MIQMKTATISDTEVSFVFRRRRQARSADQAISAVTRRARAEAATRGFAVENSADYATLIRATENNNTQGDAHAPPS